MQENERRAVPGFDGLYTVTEDGRVYREDVAVRNKLGHLQRFPHGELTRHCNASGYVKVGLCKGGKCTGPYVHRLVAMAFHPNPDGLPEVDHLNGIRDDNRAENLEWVTKEENMRRAYESGRVRSPRGARGPVGNGHPRSKLDEEAVRTARDRKAQTGASARELAREHGVSASTMARAVKGVTWAHVAAPPH
jgi:hypothetical protein